MLLVSVPLVKRASFTLAVKKNHTNLIRSHLPKKHVWSCQAAVKPLFSYLPRRKVPTCRSRLWTSPFLFFPSNLIYHTLSVFLPPPCLSVAPHRWSAFGFIMSQQVRQMTVINNQELRLWCDLCRTPLKFHVLQYAHREIAGHLFGKRWTWETGCNTDSAKTPPSAVYLQLVLKHMYQL